MITVRAPLAWAQGGPLRIVIDEGVIEPMPVAVPSFIDEGGAGDHAQNIARVVAADLAATLSTGTLTVFAPTNAAFAALLTELGVSKEALLANKPLLTAVLTYHVLGSTVARADVPLGKAITPVSGGFFKIESNNGLKITDGRNRVSTITATDIQARAISSTTCR